MLCVINVLCLVWIKLSALLLSDNEFKAIVPDLENTKIKYSSFFWASLFSALLIFIIDRGVIYIAVSKQKLLNEGYCVFDPIWIRRRGE